MLVILICIHWLECGRHELSSDLCSNGSQIHAQLYATIVTFCLHSFYIQNVLMAKSRHKAIQMVKIVQQYQIKIYQCPWVVQYFEQNSSACQRKCSSSRFCQIKMLSVFQVGHFVLVMKLSSSGAGAALHLNDSSFRPCQRHAYKANSITQRAGTDARLQYCLMMMIYDGSSS